jgi:fluoride ion exporter CrcB/FEX
MGILGGFTTLSSFSFDTLTSMRGGVAPQAMANVIGQVGFSLVAV